MLHHDVELKQIQLDVGDEITDSFFRNCIFCEKLMKITPLNFKSLAAIGNGEYCPFCLRHNFHHRDNHNILVFSFRAILGYYYHRFYRCRNPRIWFSEIETFLEKQALVGLQNPALTFDPFTFLWFADFNKIGTDKHKAAYEEIEFATKRMFELLEVSKHVSPYVSDQMWDRFHKAMKAFYQKRKRPKGKRMLIPTLADLTHNETEEFFEQTRQFNRSCLIVK